MNEIFEYAKYFTPGQRVRVDIPLPDGNFFHEWGELLSLNEDLIELQLSRDALPTEAVLNVGLTITLRTGSMMNGYRCRSIIVATGIEEKLTLRLIGEIILDELREYFRIDVYLPLQISVIEGATDAEITKEWLRRRETRARNRLWDNELQHDPVPPPKAANISGGGLKVTVPFQLEPDDLVLMEVYLPLLHPVVVGMVGRVITTHEIRSGSDILYSTAIRFHRIDERDRDRLIHYLTSEQLAQLRHYRQGLEGLCSGDSLVNRKTQRTVKAIALCSLLCLLFIWFLSWYYHHQPKSEIHRIFEQGLLGYINNFK